MVLSLTLPPHQLPPPSPGRRGAHCVFRASAQRVTRCTKPSRETIAPSRAVERSRKQAGERGRLNLAKMVKIIRFTVLSSLEGEPG